MGGEWICLGVVDLLGIISFFLLSLVVRKLVVGYLKDTNAGEWLGLKESAGVPASLVPVNPILLVSYTEAKFQKAKQRRLI